MKICWRIIVTMVLVVLLFNSAFAETITGRSQQATKKVLLHSGLAIFELSHSGESNFIVHLLDANGEMIDGLTNNIGNFKGSKAVHIEKTGYYLFNVKADGNWKIIIKQPNPTTGIKTKPFVLKGKGQQASNFFYFNKGLTTFKLVHNGNSNFIVHLIDNKGELVDGLVNEIGSFSGSKAVRIEKSGVYLLQIKADSNWTITIE